MTNQQGHPEKPPLIPHGRGRLVLFSFTIALIFTFFAGFFFQRSFFESKPQDSVSILNQFLHSENSQENLRFEFSGVRDFPSGAGLEEWLEGFPEKNQVQKIEAHFVAVYAFDGNGEWDLFLDYQNKKAILSSPLPEFLKVEFNSNDLKVDSSPNLSSNDLELVHRFVEEKVRRVLSQEEEARVDSRLTECRERLTRSMESALKRAGLENFSVDVKFIGDISSREEP